MEHYFGFAQELLQSGRAGEGSAYGADSLYDYAVQFQHDAVFYVDVARQCRGKVLDVGCGSGRMLLPLAEAGIACAGMDLSPEMLRLAAAKLDAYGYQVPLHQGDMEAFHLGERFAGIVIPYQSMMYMTSPQRRRRALQCMAAHLQPGGLLAFDFDCSEQEVGDSLPYLALQGVHPFHGHVMLQVVQTRIFADGRRLLNQINYDLTEPVRITVQASEESSCSVEEMREHLQQAGFRIVGLYQDYERTPYQAGPECVVLAEKVVEG